MKNPNFELGKFSTFPKKVLRWASVCHMCSGTHIAYYMALDRPQERGRPMEPSFVHTFLWYDPLPGWISVKVTTMVPLWWGVRKKSSVPAGRQYLGRSDQKSPKASEAYCDRTTWRPSVPFQSIRHRSVLDHWVVSDLGYQLIPGNGDALNFAFFLPKISDCVTTGAAGSN